MENTDFAGFWRRFIAYVLDDVLISMLAVLSGFIAFFAGLGGLIASGGAILYVYSILLFCSYYALFESSRFQATPGKMVAGIKVTDIAGNRVGFVKALIRQVAKLLSALVLGLGFLMIGFDKRKQGLHDKIAGCLVLKSEVNQAKRFFTAPGAKKRILTGIAAVAVVILFLVGGIILWIYTEVNRGAEMVERIGGLSVSEAEEVCDAESGMNQYACLIALSIKTNDTKYCLRITDEVQRMVCIDYVAERAEDPALCGVLEDRDQTLYCEARAGRNQSKCEQIEDEFLMRQCERYVSLTGE